MLKDNKKSDFLNQLTFEPKPGPTGINLSGFLEKRELVEIAGACITDFQNLNFSKGKSMKETKEQ
jgi:hypothetical protein